MPASHTPRPAPALHGEPVSNDEWLGGPLFPPNTPTASKAQAAPDVAPLVGLRIRLRRTIDVPCGECGETAVAIGPGAGPHVASLNCASCNRHRGWLPRTVAEFLLATIARFGRPHEPITIRNSEFAQAQHAQANGAAPSGAIAAPTSAPSINGE